MSALLELKKRLVLHPEDTSARFELAEALFGAGDYSGAAAAAERVLRDRPSDENARRLLVRSHQRGDRPELARTVLQEAVRLHPDDVSLRDELAEMLVQQDRVDDALLALEDADARAADAERLLRMAVLFMRVRLPARAREALLRHTELVPDDAEAARLLQELELELGDPSSEQLLDSAWLQSLEGNLRTARDALRARTPGQARRALALAGPAERATEAFALLRAEAFLQLGQRRRGRDLLASLDLPAARARLAALSGAAPAPVAQIGQVGVLGWHPNGGCVSPLQAAAVPGSGELHVSGNVGESGREAARVAFSCVKARAKELGVADEVRSFDLHVHYADTELAKDGGSAGLGLALAGISAFTRTPLLPALAVTGEITLLGEVKPIAGVHEKLVAACLARRAHVVVPRRNQGEVAKLPPEVQARLTIIKVDTLAEAVRQVLVR